MDTLIEEALHKIGEVGLKAAVQMHEFQNRSFNLEDSYGYAVYKNGAIVGSPVVLNPKATETKKWKGKSYSGHKEAVDFLTEYKPDNMGWTLVVVAGMFYAAYVERYYNLDVLQSSQLQAEMAAEKFLKGIDIGEGDGLVRAKKVEQINDNTFKIILTQGKKRQVRRMFKVLGLDVKDLKRIRVDGVNLGDLTEGKWEFLKESELEK